MRTSHCMQSLCSEGLLNTVRTLREPRHCRSVCEGRAVHGGQEDHGSH